MTAPPRINYQILKEHVDKFEVVRDALLEEAGRDGVACQMIIEMLVCWHSSIATRGNTIEACYVADSINKHAKQLLTDSPSMVIDGPHRK